MRTAFGRAMINFFFLNKSNLILKCKPKLPSIGQSIWKLLYQTGNSAEHNTSSFPSRATLGRCQHPGK